MNDYEFFKDVLTLCQIDFKEDKDKSGNPFWLTSKERSEPHFHAAFDANGNYMDFKIGYDKSYCLCQIEPLT